MDCGERERSGEPGRRPLRGDGVWNPQTPCQARAARSRPPCGSGARGDTLRRSNLLSRSTGWMTAVAIWAFLDFTSPLSAIADAALGRLETEGRARLHPRALELYPAPLPLPPPGGAEWDEAHALAAEKGVELILPGFRPRTAKAHEAARIAAEHGRGAAMRAAIFAAYWGEGRDIGRIDVLVDLGEGIGLDTSELKAALDVDRWSARVERESAEARRLGIDRVPALVIGGSAGARLLLGPVTYGALRATLDARATL